MQMMIGITPVDFLHENGSLLADIRGLSECFGLTVPELDELTDQLPEIFPVREGYIPLGLFLSAFNKIMREDLKDEPQGEFSMSRLREIELRAHNYVFLVGFMGRDLLGAAHGHPGFDPESGMEHAAGPDDPETEAPAAEPAPADPKALWKAIGEFGRMLHDSAELYTDLQDQLAGLEPGAELPDEFYDTATSLLDMMQSACWEYTRWYSLHAVPRLAEEAEAAADGADEDDTFRDGRP
ncbi:MAG: hypothetical protein Q4F72_04525 [Desulfovibrionaceae bacterium]|nr:hypothetical protein [Desulfovibrionaceae bacterium]